MAQVSTPPQRLRKLQVPMEGLLNALMFNSLLPAGADTGKHFFQETHYVVFGPTLATLLVPSQSFLDKTAK